MESPDGYKSKKPVKKGVIALIGAALVAVLFLVIFLPIYFTVIRPREQKSSNGSSAIINEPDSGSTENGPSPPVETSEAGSLRGGHGSTITKEDGSTFTYQNDFGGLWVEDPADPFNNDARPNSWTPPLNTSWQWGTDRIYGVNLGGLFVLEPFISPEIFQRYPGALDEFMLSEAMAADTANGGLEQILEEHYNTFITEEDIAEIAGAGLNWIRVPIGFWAVETWPGETFLERTSWRYFLRIVKWARKYGLRICLDLHALPGSQNAYNHSGRLNNVNFLEGPMGIANAERALYYLRVFTQFISQPQYLDIIQAIELVNEPLAGQIGFRPLNSFYIEAYQIIRGITGVGSGNGPYIILSDGLQAMASWEGLLPGADRVGMDGHPYFAFVDTPILDPISVPAEDGLAGGTWPRRACDAWGPTFATSRTNFGVTFGGEFSGAVNDCGLYLRGIHNPRSFHPQCPEYDAWETYNATMKEGIQSFITASFDAIGDFFFWTWKIGESIEGRVDIPLWSYKLGLEQGWIPRDPRESIGKCQRLGATFEPFQGPFSPAQTGGNPSATVAADYLLSNPWPPASINSINVPIEFLPRYTNTAPVITLPEPTYTGAPASATQGLDGWFNDNDTEGGIAEAVECTYPDRYIPDPDYAPIAPCPVVAGVPVPTPEVTPGPTIPEVEPGSTLDVESSTPEVTPAPVL
ncbi:exo-beta-1,3-glucanase [Coprinopsis marcescibilis]|uniref:glucan 1,3-beta-glucosidase n=1 Tax=Coprinopsis marcescibilis TaxID=230819 RepID=A0A5C3KGP4_COPMA|nr:exo-beta-1,3-glucanase [Coprinopsis marcescibilis]